MTQVAHGSAYSGHYRQVVFKIGFTSGITILRGRGGRLNYADAFHKGYIYIQNICTHVQTYTAVLHSYTTHVPACLQACTCTH